PPHRRSRARLHRPRGRQRQKTEGTAPEVPRGRQRERLRRRVPPLEARRPTSSSPHGRQPTRGKPTHAERSAMMATSKENEPASDALVFFGATGDLAYKKIFPALQSMVKRGHLSVPVIGVAGRSWTSDQLRARARASLEEHGGVDPEAFDKLSRLLRYVGGDY